MEVPKVDNDNRKFRSKRRKKMKGFCGAKPSQPTGLVVEDGGQEEITERLCIEQDYPETEPRSNFTLASKPNLRWPGTDIFNLFFLRVVGFKIYDFIFYELYFQEVVGFKTYEFLFSGSRRFSKSTTSCPQELVGFQNLRLPENRNS